MEKVEIPIAILNEGLQKGTLSFKWHEEPEQIASRIASPLCFDSAFAPYIEVTYAGPATVPDLAVYRGDIQFSAIWPAPGDLVTMTATVHNNGTSGTTGVEVRFYDGSPFDGGLLIGTVYTGDIPGEGGTTQVSIDWLTSLGRHNIYVWVDPQGLVAELHKTNNLGFRTLYVRDDYTLYQNDFDLNDDLEWSLDSDNLILPDGVGPHLPQHPMFVGGHRSSEDNHTPMGSYSMRLVFDGRNDDGTIWILRPIPLFIPKGASRTIEVTFWAKKSLLSSATPVYVVAGIATIVPEVEKDFDGIRMSQQIWEEYTYHSVINAGPVPFNKEIFVAIGINMTQSDVVDSIHYIDDIVIRIL